MKIDFVHPAHYRDDGSLVQGKGLLARLDAYLPHLGLPLLAAHTPPGHELRLVEEYLEDIDWDRQPDLVALSAQIMQIDRAKDIARAWRARGVKTVLGGYLPSLMPEAVEGYFDAIVPGEGDGVWAQVVADAEAGRLAPRYEARETYDLAQLPVPRYDLIKANRLVVYPVQATRGCPFRCTYCSIAAVYDGGYRTRPVADILRDIEATGSRNINFCDDNLCEKVRFAEELFDAMAGTRVRWGTQTTINVARHPALLEKARKAGCSLMALGVETLSARNLAEVDKTFHRVDRFAEGFRRIQDAGISPHALIIFGLPEDDLDVFKKTVDYLADLKVPIAQFFLLTPYPGTKNGDALWDTTVFDKNPAHLREPYVVFQPERLTPDQLRAGWWSALEDFYSLGSIVRRVLLRRRNRGRLIDLATNLVYWLKIKRGIHPVYFG
ncbi:MAG: radical SAM protein [bacterium]